MLPTERGCLRIVLIDDHQMVLDALAARISRDSSFEVVGTATRADEGLRVVLDARPDIVVLDVEVPGRGAFDVAAEISSKLKNVKLVFLTGYLSDVRIAQAVRLKASGYLLKGESVAFLLEALRRIGQGEVCYSAEVARRITRNGAGPHGPVTQYHSPLSGLTSRQLEVLRFLARGRSVKEVAREMHLSEKSVDSHKYRIMHKLNIHDRVELARFAIREGLTTP